MPLRWRVLLCLWCVARSQLAPEVPVLVNDASWAAARPRARGKVLAAALMDSQGQLDSERGPKEEDEENVNTNVVASGASPTSTLPEPETPEVDGQKTAKNQGAKEQKGDTIVFHEYSSIEDCQMRSGGKIMEVPLRRCLRLADVEMLFNRSLDEVRRIEEGSPGQQLEEEEAAGVVPLFAEVFLNLQMAKRPYHLYEEVVREGLGNMSATHILLEAASGKGTAKFCDANGCSRCLLWPMVIPGQCGLSFHGHVSAYWRFPDKEPPNPYRDKYTLNSGASPRAAPRFVAQWVIMGCGLLSTLLLPWGRAV